MKSQENVYQTIKDVRKARPRVFVGLSGGVDSAVSAALLKKAGYEVSGVFIKVWQPEWIECTWKEDRRDAMRVAAHLDIPFYTLNLEKEYKEGVIDYMIEEYRKGRTPNPDVMCNREVKFGAFWKWAKEKSADYIATGHYAMTDGSRLFSGIDKNKDQSYFLWTLNQNDLPHVLFPVGHLVKPQVRDYAEKFGLPNALKKDSQGLCFIGKVDLKEFLAHYIKPEKGRVLNEAGEIVGTHPGALFFTIGERHGFTMNQKTPQDSPFYVIDKDAEQNTITVSNKKGNLNSKGPKDAKGLAKGLANGPEPAFLPNQEKKVKIDRVNWVRGEVPELSGVNEKGKQSTKEPFPFLVRCRYRAELKKARIVSVNFGETLIEFEKPEDTLTPGQSLVIYDSKGEGCIGGGVINI